MNGDTLGAACGDEGHQLTAAQLAAHTHSAGSYQTTIPTNATDEGSDVLLQRNIAQPSSTNSFPVTGSSGSVGSNAEHNNVQPTFILNYIIKT